MQRISKTPVRTRPYAPPATLQRYSQVLPRNQKAQNPQKHCVLIARAPSLAPATNAGKPYRARQLQRMPCGHLAGVVAGAQGSESPSKDGCGSSPRPGSGAACSTGVGQCGGTVLRANLLPRS